MYPSREVRNATIEEQSGRPAAELIADVAEAHDRFVGCRHDARRATGRPSSSGEVPSRADRASFVPWLRRTEVEIHHVDLDLDYTLAHWPEDFVERLLSETTTDFSAREDMESFTLVGNEDQGRWDVAGGGREINGPPPALLGWLLGRSEGIALHTEGDLPTIGVWR